MTKETDMKKENQRGISLISLMFAIAFLGFFLLLGMKSLPAWNEYFAVLRAVKTIESSGETSVAGARKTFDKFAEVDRIETIKGSDVTFVAENGHLKGQFEYESRVSVAGNVSLLFNFANK
jgi:type II secretory pathway pseudopilin PulG